MASRRAAVPRGSVLWGRDGPCAPILRPGVPEDYRERSRRGCADTGALQQITVSAERRARLTQTASRLAV